MVVLPVTLAVKAFQALSRAGNTSLAYCTIDGKNKRQHEEGTYHETKMTAAAAAVVSHARRGLATIERRAAACISKEKLAAQQYGSTQHTQQSLSCMDVLQYGPDSFFSLVKPSQTHMKYESL